MSAQQHRPAASSVALDWMTWATRAVVVALAAWVWQQHSAQALAAERIAVLQSRVERVEASTNEKLKDEREELRKVANEAASQGQLLVRLETTLTGLKEKLDALLARPRR